MSETETLRRGINVAIAYLRAGGGVNAATALRVLEEAKATPRETPVEAREVTGLEFRGG